MPFKFGGVIARRLILITSLHLGLGLVAWGLATASWPDLMTVYFRYLGPAFLVSFAVLELELARHVRRAFEPGDDMRHAWTLIMLGAGLRVQECCWPTFSILAAIRTMAHIISVRYRWYSCHGDLESYFAYIAGWDTHSG